MTVEALGTPGVLYKSAEFNWIGRVDSLVNMVFLWHTSPVKTFADAQRIESKLSGTGVGSTVSIYPTVRFMGWRPAVRRGMEVPA